MKKLKVETQVVIYSLILSSFVSIVVLLFDWRIAVCIYCGYLASLFGYAKTWLTIDYTLKHDVKKSKYFIINVITNYVVYLAVMLVFVILFKEFVLFCFLGLMMIKITIYLWNFTQIKAGDQKNVENNR